MVFMCELNAGRIKLQINKLEVGGRLAASGLYKPPEDFMLCVVVLVHDPQMLVV